MRPGPILIAAALFALAATSSRGAGASNWRVYDTNDGLAETGCVSVTIGRHKVWVEGLKTRSVSGLDGYTNTAIPPPGAFNSRIYESSGPQLWATCEDGLQEFRDDKWLHYPVQEITAFFRTNHSAAPNAVPLCPTRLGRTIFLLPDALMQLDVESQDSLKISVLQPATKTGIGTFLGMTVTPPNGSLWIAGRRGLARLGPARNVNSDTKWDEFPPPEGLRIQNLREPEQDEDGGVTVVADIIGSNRKLIVRFDGQNWQTWPVGDENIRLAWRGPDKTPWAATSDSVFQWDGEHGEMVPNEDISGHQIHDLAVEPGGVFWLAASDGLFRYTPPAWRTPAVLQKLNSPINGIAGGQEGRLWVASAGSLHLLQSNRWKSFPFPGGAGGDFSSTRAIYALGNGAVVIQTGERLFQFDPRTEQFTNLPERGRRNSRAIGLLRDGRLCVQTTGPESGDEPLLLEVYDGVDFKPFPSDAPPAGLGSGLLLHSSQSGNLWLAGTKGISRLREQKWQMFAPAAGEKMPDGFSGLVEITEDRVWCGFQDSIWEYDGKNKRPVRTGLDHVNALVNGRDSGIWVACDNGLLRYYREAWNTVGVEEGLPGAKVRTVLEDRGAIWAGTDRGLSLYVPEADPDSPLTYVVGSGTDNTVPKGSPLTVNFGARDKWKFTPASRLLYSTRLDQQDWQLFQEARTVTLTELTPGEHFFQVQSMDRNWNKDPTPAKFDFTVVLPWYEERRLLLISSAGLAVALFFAALAFNRHRRLVRSYAEVEAKVTLRTKQLERAGQELLHSQKMNALGTLAAGIAHDFNNILSIIKGSAQIIEDNLDNQDKVRIRTSRIKTVVEQGAGIVKAMLGFTHGSGGELAMCDVNATLEETIKLLGDRFQREVEVRYAPSPALPLVPASRDFIQQILLNFIFNAAEAMTGQKQVILSSRKSGQLPANLVLAPASAPEHVFISVKDFGSGIQPEIMPRIFEPFFTTKSLSARRGTGLGLSMVYELARQMQAGLAVESDPGQGSTFHLIIAVRELPVDSARETN